jgi:hypothetical protein
MCLNKIIHCDIFRKMKTGYFFVSKIYMNGSAVCLQFDPSFLPAIQPGQYVSARADGDILPATLFPCGMDGRDFTTIQPIPVAWQPDVSLSIRYPLGKGFAVPSSARRLLMVSTGNNPLRLLPAAGTMLANGGEAALFSNNLPGQVPSEVELLTHESLADACAWADCIIGDTPIDQLSTWKGMVTRGERVNPQRDIQVLLDTQMACHGTAECGVCAVKTRHGWKNACSDGPVFPLAELDI